ncbi:bifunctional phosphoglucose/phosphomannose isomerase [Halothermothrix orenii]|uniref:Phosphoglucose/phosphomannose isomerase n=1 Tax=Halothermothrix orenii (strain H 168 / OCM 544 / DSM 9562) TaxID=373903 RepID=B8D166_HALOH|nr:bifunctional phosphoglucose/phosphomannose isomerase [Halothermothrix orenii]ACL71018.1 phosphoglucose/phosphomannose isomerase [Halothermothrix orenii H 168]
MLIDLNNIEKVKEIDSQKAIETTENYDSQFQEGLKLGQSIEIEELPDRIDNIILLGTGGGSAITGGLLQSYLFDELPVPLYINQGYNIPAWVDENTLVLVVSHSGNTEEIVNSFKQAEQRGACIFILTSGGILGEKAREQGIPHLIVPRDIGHPRRDLGYIFIPLLALLNKLGLIEDKTGEVLDLIELFGELKNRYRLKTPLEKNPAKQLAVDLDNYIPLIYGSLDYYDVVAWRWKNQFGENGKKLAFYNVIPNLHHDEAVGWEMEKEVLERFYLVVLRDSELDLDNIKKRKDVTVEILRERIGKVIEVYAEGHTRLARMFSLIYLGDFVTIYHAIARGIDPTPVNIIDYFKKKMME